MKKIEQMILVKAAYVCAKSNANSTCISLFYQPRVPEKVKKLKKYK